MRRITRNFLLGLLLVVVLLLALGALPSYLRSGDPYYVSATAAEANGPTVNATDLSERRFPYTTTAIERGRSDPYWKGPLGIKESFTHTPFDEFAAFRQRNPEAATESGIYVSRNGTRYRVELARNGSRATALLRSPVPETGPYATGHVISASD